MAITLTQGFFITVEGIEGAGKTSQLDNIKAQLEQAGYQVIFTREPGGTLLGEDLRALLLGHKHHNMADDAELLLMFAARAQHLNEVILPALAQGKVVLCDRFTDATYAYQGGGRGIAMQRIEQIENWVQKGLKPDLTLLLDLPVEVGLMRASQRSTPDRFEREKALFFEKVRQAYLDLAAKEARFTVIDASQSLEHVTQEIHQRLQLLLSQ